MKIPFICLSDRLEITDASHRIKSLSAFRRDKDFLLTVLCEDDLTRVEELCTVTQYNNSVSLKLKRSIDGYSFAKAVRNTDGGAVLYLSKDCCDLSLEGYTDCPDEILSEELFITDDFTSAQHSIDFTALTGICVRAASRLSSSQLLAGRILRIEPDGSDRCNASSSFNAEAILFTAFSLACAAARGTVGDIILSINHGEFTFGISVRTQLCRIPPFVGSSFDVMSLCAFLRGSRPFMRKALLCADSADMKLSFDISPDGTLCLNASNISALTPVTEFKFPENVIDEHTVTEKLISFLLTAQEQEDQKH